MAHLELCLAGVEVGDFIQLVVRDTLQEFLESQLAVGSLNNLGDLAGGVGKVQQLSAVLNHLAHRRILVGLFLDCFVNKPAKGVGEDRSLSPQSHPCPACL